MKLLNKLDTLFPQGERRGGSKEIERGNLQGLGMMQAFQAHTDIKDRLHDILHKNHQINQETTEFSDEKLCVIGAWLDGEGKRLYGHLEEFTAACKAHTNFHACAKDILLKNAHGDVAESINLFKTKFRTATNRCRLEMVKLSDAAKP